MCGPCFCGFTSFVIRRATKCYTHKASILCGDENHVRNFCLRMIFARRRRAPGENVSHGDLGHLDPAAPVLHAR
jgi:hypothetical protein